jgi:hypothetical protein
MTKIILHVGASKTGTTSIQTLMSEYSDMFRSHGIYYPTFYNDIPILYGGNAYNNIYQNLELEQDLNYKKFIIDICNNSKKLSCPITILSSEVLCDLSLDKKLKLFQELKNTFSEVVLVSFIREPFDWIVICIDMDEQADRANNFIFQYINHKYRTIYEWLSIFKASSCDTYLEHYDSSVSVLEVWLSILELSSGVKFDKVLKLKLLNVKRVNENSNKLKLVALLESASRSLFKSFNSINKNKNLVKLTNLEFFKYFKTSDGC